MKIDYEVSQPIPYEIFDELYSYYPRGQNEMYASVRTGNCKFFIVAKDGNRIVGCLGIKELHKNKYRYLHLVVHPDYQNNGIGTQILKQAPKILKKMGAVYIENHKRENKIKHSVFTDAKFKLKNVRTEKGEKYTTYVWKLKDITADRG